MCISCTSMDAIQAYSSPKPVPLVCTHINVVGIKCAGNNCIRSIRAQGSSSISSKKIARHLHRIQHTYAHTHARACASMHTHMHVHTHTHRCTRTHARIHGESATVNSIFPPTHPGIGASLYFFPRFAIAAHKTARFFSASTD